MSHLMQRSRKIEYPVWILAIRVPPPEKRFNLQYPAHYKASLDKSKFYVCIGMSQVILSLSIVDFCGVLKILSHLFYIMGVVETPVHTFLEKHPLSSRVISCCLLTCFPAY